MDQQPAAMKALDFLIGHWHTTGEIIPAGETPATIIKGTDSYEWVLNGCFILHKAAVMMGDEKMEVIELIGDFDPGRKLYKMRSFDSQGSFMTMDAHIDEQGALRIRGDHMRSTLSIKDNHTLNAYWEKSEDDQNWQPWMSLRFSK